MSDRSAAISIVRKSIIRSVCTFVLSIALPHLYYADPAPRIIRLGYYDANPSCYRDAEGRPRGIFIDIVKKLAEREGWQIQYIYDSWDNLLAALKTGNVDLVPAIVKTTERETFAAFTDESIMTDWGVVFTKAGKAPISIMDLHNKKVGALEQDFWFSGPHSFKELCDSFDIHPIYQYYADYSTMFTELARDKIDAAVGSNSLGIVYTPLLPIVSTSILYNPIELRFASSLASQKGGRKLVLELDSAIRQLKRDSPEYFSSILSTYQIPLRREFVTPLWLFLSSIATGLVLLIAVIMLVIQRRARREGELRLASFFEDSPISLWEEDFSAVKHRIDEARMQGESDWEAYYKIPHRLEEHASLVKVLDVNKATMKLLGFNEKPKLVTNLPQSIGLQNLEPLRLEFIAFAKGETSVEGETVHIRNDGERISVFYKVSIMPGYEQSWSRVLVSLVDLSERKKVEDALIRSLAEKELLLREVHHRVKNNLQVICSLINLQMNVGSRSLADRNLLVDIETRVRAMSLVHETLYHSDDFSSVDVSSYVERLCNDLIEVYSVDRNRIKLNVSVEDISMQLETAINCGLIVNELVVNAFKHAFPDGKSGLIEVVLSKLADGMVSLIVRDNGVGVHDIDSTKNSTIGLNLVKTLSDQLNGSYSVDTENGMCIRIIFPLPDCTSRSVNNALC
jgi:polar amino acid transport system substrate-binding protein